jgi:hypothetical protein
MRGASVNLGDRTVRALIAMGKRSDEILDLTAPAEDGDGIVARWLRESLAFSTPEPARILNGRVEKTAV